MKKLTVFFVLSIFMGSFALAKDKGQKRHRESHVHGLGEVNLVVEDMKLFIELEIPAHDVVGFEHWPSTSEQKEKVKSAVKTLSTVNSLFKISPKAQCQLSGKVKVNTELLEKDHDDGHDHHHGHDHGENSQSHKNHSEFKGTYMFTCKDIKSLKKIEFIFFKKFSELKTIKVQAVLPNNQLSKNLNPNSFTLILDQ